VNYKQDWNVLNESPIHVHVTMASSDGMHWNRIQIDLLSFPQIFTALHATFSDFKRLMLRVVDDGRESWVNECVDTRTLQGTGWDGCVAMIRAVMSVVRRIQMPVRRKEADAGWKALGAIDSPGSMMDAVKFAYHCLKTATTSHSARPRASRPMIPDSPSLRRRFSPRLSVRVGGPAGVSESPSESPCRRSRPVTT
jgi:hypothetical protein